MPRASVDADGPTIARLRGTKGLTQDTLAVKAGCSKKTVENIERTGRTTQETLVRIAKALDVASEELLRPTVGSERVSLACFTRPPDTPLIGRKEQLSELDRCWTATGQSKPNIATVVTWGGQGKSALLQEWLKRLERQSYRGADRVYCFTFQDRGVGDDTISAADFIEHAWGFFVGGRPQMSSRRLLGDELARHIRDRRTLLVLDGLEALQFPPGECLGKLKPEADAIAALVSTLAERNKGLCVLSSRLPISDLSGFREPTVCRIELPPLAPEDGARLLKQEGVKGSHKELQQAATAFGGHCFALQLLARYLKHRYPLKGGSEGDARRWRAVPRLESDERDGADARRVMACYDKWFKDKPERALLRLLGFYDEPAGAEAMKALCQPPLVPGLNETIPPPCSGEWNSLLAHLRELHLLLDPDPDNPEAVNAHALVREHFGESLRRETPDAWKEGHRRLFEYLRPTADVRPPPSTTFDEMKPLYKAVAHGCKAGCHRLALNEVYKTHIQRDREYYSTRKLGGGAIDAELEALADFFRNGWSRIVEKERGETDENLHDDEKAYVLAEVGCDLRYLGRLADATTPLTESLTKYAALAQETRRTEDWVDAALVADELSAVHLLLGDMKKALAFGDKSLQLADSSGDFLQRMSKRTTRGEALLRAGMDDEAEMRFREAWEIRPKMLADWKTRRSSSDRSPFPPLYSSLFTYRYGDWLIHRKQFTEASRVANAELRLWGDHGDRTDHAFCHLLFGRVLSENLEAGSKELAEGRQHLERAVTDLRLAGREDYLPLALVALARLQVTTAVRSGSKKLDTFSVNLVDASKNCQEALSISDRCRMLLHKTDCHLCDVGWHLAMGDAEAARESFAKAEALVDEIHYDQCRKELDELKRKLTR